MNKITESDKGSNGNIKRAGKKLGLIDDDRIVFEEEVDSNILMDYLLFEKNGHANRLIDRFSKKSADDVGEIELMLLNGMLNSHFSLFEVKDTDKENYTLKLFDILEKKNFTLFDIGLSKTTHTGMLFATRLVPVEDVYITSGLTFAFKEINRLKLLTEISRQSRKSNRKRSTKIKASKNISVTLLETMYIAYKKWGIETLTFEH